MLLFLIASGVTLIFGVLNVINFAHGSLYMVGAYVALHAVPGQRQLLHRGVRRGASPSALLGVVFERLLMSKVYGSNVLMQLLVCYAVILICDDLVKIIWGPSGLSMGMPAEFRLPPLRFMGGVVPPFYLFMIVGGDGDRRWRCGWSSSARASARSCAPPRSTGRWFGARHPREPLLCRRVRHRQRAGRRRRRAGRAGAVADARHGLLDPDRVLHRHGDRRHGLDRRRLRGGAADRLHARRSAASAFRCSSTA